MTTNYDTLPEHALGCDEFNYGQIGEELKGERQFDPESYADNVPILKGDIPVAKIHGSLSWDSEARHADCSPGLNGKAFIIPPAEDKSSLYGQVQEVWKLAEEILSQADEIVLFGFSFNPLDRAVIELLEDGAPSKVLLINPHPNLGIAASIWPDAEVASTDPSVSLDGVKDWLPRK